MAIRNQTVTNEIKLKKVDYKAKSRKKNNFSRISLPITFLRNIITEVLSTEDADKEESKLFKELRDINTCEKPI